MKNLIVLLVYLLNICKAGAQDYTISSSPITGSNPPSYVCTITPKSGTQTPPFDNQDLITWLFPDGQFAHWEIETYPITSNNVVNKSNEITWTPYVDAPSGPNNVVAYVAKKGKPGNPSRNDELLPITINNPSGTPDTFAMPSSSTWQINETWEFSPGYETFLIVSYRIASTCQPGSQIVLKYKTDELDTVAIENLAYQNENITTFPSSTTGENLIFIKLFNYNNKINHVYIKVKTKETLRIGDTIHLSVSTNICGIGTENSLQFFAKGTPHDPNEKLVNHQIVCDSQPNSADLSYYIRFQNDGNAPVDDVYVEDDLANELNKATLTLGDVPNFPTVYAGSDTTTNTFHIQFKKLNLPGLKQTNPHYAYDQTTYAFTYNVCTNKTLAPNILYNGARVSFYDLAHATFFTPVYTTYALTLITDTSCYKPNISCTVSTTEQAGIINNLTISPNPFTEEILISLDLEEKTRLQAFVRDLNGRLVDQLTNSEYTSGAHEIHWNAAQMPAGVYLLDVQTEHGRITRKIIKM